MNILFSLATLTEMVILSKSYHGTETSPYSGDVCGLFGATSGTIEDVVLENVSINYVGGNHSSGYGFRMGGALVGYSMGDIVNCTVIGLDMKAGSDGSYVALNSIGGLVGIQDGDTTVSHSRVSGKIEESTKRAMLVALLVRSQKAHLLNIAVQTFLLR